MTPLLSPAPFLLQAAAPGARQGGGTFLIIQFGLILAIIYFLMIRPQQKQRKQHEERLRNLKRGDSVVTTGGLVGEVMHIKETTKDGTAEKSMDDHVTLKSGDSRLIVERGRIARVTTGTSTAAPDA